MPNSDTANALVDANDARKSAEKALAEAKRSEEDANAVVDFLIGDVLGAVAPAYAKGRVVTVAEVLTDAEKKVENAFVGQPLAEARVRWVIGNIRSDLGQFDRAERHLRRARDLFIEYAGPEHHRTLLESNSLACVLMNMGKLDEGQKLHEAVFAAQLRTIGADCPETAVSMNNLGIISLPSKVDLRMPANFSRRRSLSTSVITDKVIATRWPTWETLRTRSSVKEDWTKSAAFTKRCLLRTVATSAWMIPSRFQACASILGGC